MRPTLSLLFLLGLTPLLAQTEATSPQVVAAWDAFQVAHEGAWKVDWNHATGTPAAIWGPGLRASVAPVTDEADARRVAGLFVEQHRALLGLGQTQVSADIVQRIGDVWILVYQQRWRGLQVHGARVDVRLRTSGEVALFGASALAIDPAFDIMPRLDEAQARAFAATHLRVNPVAGPLAAAGGERLVVWADVDRTSKTTARLAWEVPIRTDGDGFFGRAYVDAATGFVLQTISDRHACGCIAPSARKPLRHLARVHAAALPRCESEHDASPHASPLTDTVSGTVDGWVNTDRLPDAALTRVPMPRLRVVTRAGGSTWGQFFYTGSDGTFTVLTDSFATSVVVEFWLDGNRMADVATAQGIELFYSVTLPNRSTGNVITFGSASATEFDRAQTTAYWQTDDVSTWAAGILGRARIATLDAAVVTVNDPRTCNAWYTANTMTYFSTSTTCVNAAYRSIIHHEWGHGLDDVYGGMSTRDGLSEGNADIVATFRSDDPVVAPGFYRDGRTSNYLRTALNTKRYPTAGSVHTMGEVWMGCAWDMRARLIASLGPVAGKARAELLLLGSIAGNGRRLATAVRDVFILDDNDPDLCNGTPNYTALSAACEARDIPYPEAPCTATATVVTVGTGCPGTGSGVVCWSANAGATTLATAPSLPADGVYALAFTPQRPLTISGFSLLTRSAGATPTTVSVALLNEDVGDGLPGIVLAGPVTLSVGVSEDWYTATFAAPLPLGPMARYFLVVTDTGAGNIAPPIASSGVNVGAFYSETAGSGWSGLHQAPFAYRLHCPPSPRPFLGSSNTAVLGEDFSVHLHGAPAFMPVSLWFGASSSSWMGRPLPLDFGPFRAPGCAMLVSWDLSLTFMTTSVGTLQLAIPVPNDLGLGGLPLFMQALVVDLPANGLGMTVTNGLRATLGR